MLREDTDFSCTVLPDRGVLFEPDFSVESDPYSDRGSYFQCLQPNFVAPPSYRARCSLGTNDWLSLEFSTRNPELSPMDLAKITDSPDGSRTQSIRLAAPKHSDGVVLRSTRPLPPEYRVQVRMGYPAFGSGRMDLDQNGYAGGERGDPWRPGSAMYENGFYWLAILAELPRPRNNVWIHHQRKVVIDSDNNAHPDGPWTHIWKGSEFVACGQHPIMMFALDGQHHEAVADFHHTGPPFIAWARERWNEEASLGQIRAVDAYRERGWYDVSIEKTRDSYTLGMAGDFVYGGRRTYRASIARERVWDPPGSPDYFMLGVPHINYYRGSLYCAKIELFTPGLPGEERQKLRDAGSSDSRSCT